MDSIAKKYGLFINGFNGICALVCGAWMMLSAIPGFPFSWENWMPLSIFYGFPYRDIFFTSSFWPGLALALVSGMPNLAAAGAHRRCEEMLWVNACLVAGILLIAWTVVELVLIPNGLSVFYFVIGALQIVAAVRMRREEEAQ